MSKERLDGAKNLFFIALGIDMAVTALVAITDYWAVGVLNDIRAGATKADQSTISSLEFWESFSKVMILTLIGVGLALVRWLDACYEHAKETLKATGFAQEGWKSWGWIVPFMNVFKPYQVLSEIYKVGTAERAEGDGWKKSSGSGMLLVWWIFWVITHMVMWGIGKQAFKSSFRDDLTLNQIIGMYYGSVTVCVISLIVAALWFVVAGSLTRRLLNRSASVAASVAPTHFSVVHPSAVTVETNFSKPKAALPENDSTIPLQTAIDEDHVYAEIAKELETGVADKGLWTRLFAECSGDEKQTKVLYIKHRADRLIAAERARLEQAERERAVEADRIEEVMRQREVETQRIKEDRTKLKMIQNLAARHLSNPRMTIDEKEQLLRLAGGSFTWLNSYGRCAATFRAEEKQFPSGKEFSSWFISDVVPFLLSIEGAE